MAVSTFSGWALLIVNGLTNLTAAGLLLTKRNAGTVLGGVFGAACSAEKDTTRKSSKSDGMW